MNYAEGMISSNEFQSQWENRPDELEEREGIEAEYKAIQSGALPIEEYVERRLKKRGEARFQRDHDPLTGLLNRRGFINQFVQVTGSQVRRLEEGNTVFQGSLLLADLDSFKTVNDTYGHPAGDSVLVTFAEVVAGDLGRFGDTLGRYGGEELIIYLPDTDMAGSYAVAEKIRKSVRSNFERLFEELWWPKTVSIGIQSFRKDQIDKKLNTAEGKISLLENLTKNADIALYHSKANGRNRVTGWEEGIIMPQPQP